MTEVNVWVTDAVYVADTVAVIVSKDAVADRVGEAVEVKDNELVIVERITIEGEPESVINAVNVKREEIESLAE